MVALTAAMLVSLWVADSDAYWAVEKVGGKGNSKVEE